MNSPEMVHAFDVAAGLIRDKMAPSPQLLEAASESDLFASGRLGITWSDFTETPKYVENGVDFGIAPFYVIKDGENFVDTWTSPWGTFTDSEDKELALAFLEFIATEAQRIRPTVSADPPLSMTVAEEIGYGQDDPVKAAYLDVLASTAKPQVFVPPGVEAWDPAEVMRLLVDEGRTDTQAILDAQAQRRRSQSWTRPGSASTTSRASTGDDRPMATIRRRGGFRGDERVAILFLLPWILGLVFFLAIPLLWGIWISLTDEQIVKVGEFVGLANYEEILTDDPLFIQALGVTLKLAAHHHAAVHDHRAGAGAPPQPAPARDARLPDHPVRPDGAVRRGRRRPVGGPAQRRPRGGQPDPPGRRHR